jgi:hypothetical protein
LSAAISMLKSIRSRMVPWSMTSTWISLKMPASSLTLSATCVCMACAWHVHGMCMACAWHVHGMCMACAWLARALCHLLDLLGALVRDLLGQHERHRLLRVEALRGKRVCGGWEGVGREGERRRAHGERAAGRGLRAREGTSCGELGGGAEAGRGAGGPGRRVAPPPRRRQKSRRRSRRKRPPSHRP